MTFRNPRFFDYAQSNRAFCITTERVMAMGEVDKTVMLDKSIAPDATAAMPALLAITRLRAELEAVGADSPLVLLGQAVLHDERIISRILKVANHLAYNHSAGSITTLGRAIALLGFAPVKSVCITARFMDALLRNRSHAPEEHLRLLALLAQAFHTAMQARQLMQDCDTDTREAVYVAALMAELGEGGADNTGANARRAVELAGRFSHAVMHGWREEETAAAVQEIAGFLGVSTAVAERRLRLCTHQSCELLDLYSAAPLLEFLPPGYSHHGSPVAAEYCPLPNAEPDRALQLRLLHELAALVLEKPDFDLVLHTALEGIQRGLGMDRCLACLLDSDGEQLRPRFALGRDSDIWSRHFSMSLGGTDNIFSDVVARGVSRWVGSGQTPMSHPLCTPRALHITCGSECFVAPLQFGERVIGILYADRYVSRRPFADEDFQTFRHFTLQVRMCLQMAMQMC